MIHNNLVKKIIGLILAIVLLFNISGIAMASEVLSVTNVESTDFNVAFGEIQPGVIEIVKGDQFQLSTEGLGLTGAITWVSRNGYRNVGSNSMKRVLEVGEIDGTRRAGWATTNHIASVDGIGLVTGHQKGIVYISAVDDTGRVISWKLNVLFTDKANLPVASSDDYEILRDKWVNSLTGVNNDLSNPIVSDKIQILKDGALNNWNTYEYKGEGITGGIPWSTDLTKGTKTLTEEQYKNDGVFFRVTYQRVEIMAQAYATKEIPDLYQNQELLNDMIHIMDWLSENCYNQRSQTDNWWTWEIGLPKNVIPIVLYLYDDLNEEQRINYTDGILANQSDPFHEGLIGTASTHAKGYRDATSANLLDCSVTATGLGIILEDSEQLYMAKKATETQLVLQEAGSYANGFYEDGSYIDHEKIPYIGSYGVEFLKGSIKLLGILGNSPWKLSDEKIGMLKTYVLDGFIPAVYNGATLDMLRGRAISRPALSDRVSGAEITDLLIKLIDAVDAETAAEIKSSVKTWITENTVYDYLGTRTDIEIISKVKEIMNDDTILIGTESMHKNYPLLDRAIHIGEDYLFGLSMYSSRITNSEIMNDENLHGWHTGDGMYYLYNNDLNQYTDNFWNTVNYNRLAGTTIVPVDIGNGVPDSTGFHQAGDYFSPEDWVGGTNLGLYGINGMSLSGITVGNADNQASVTYARDLKALKSWFMFDDEIVSLGAGIENVSDSLHTETTVENRQIMDDNSNKVVIDGVETNVSEEQSITPTWVHLEGNVEDSDIGYYFPESKQTLQVRKVANTGNWGDIGTTDTLPDVTKNYLEMWFDHGTNPKEESYQYVILPNKSVDEVKDYAKNPSISILANNKEVQAVADLDLNITGANFWTDTIQTAGKITSNKKASVMTQLKGDLLEISISDPTMKNNGTIELEIADKSIEIVSMDSNVTAIIGETIKLTIDVANKFGATSKAIIKVQIPDTSKLLSTIEKTEQLLNELELIVSHNIVDMVEQMHHLSKIAISKTEFLTQNDIDLIEKKLTKVNKMITTYLKVYSNVQTAADKVKEKNPNNKDLLNNLATNIIDLDTILTK